MAALIESQEAPYCNVKCVVIGDGGVGKTSLLLTYTTGEYPEEYMPTVFETFMTERMVAGRRVHMSLCDTAGQEDYNALRPLNYPGTDIFVLCYSVVEPAGFENLKARWLAELRKHAPGAPFVLVATKCDLRDDPVTRAKLAHAGKRAVTREEGVAAQVEMGAVAFMESSAKTMEGVDEVFKQVFATALARWQSRDAERGGASVAGAGGRGQREGYSNDSRGRPRSGRCACVLQ